MNIFELIKKVTSGTISNVLWSMISKGIAMVFFLLTDIFTARILSVNGYGEWSYFYSIMSMIYWIAWFGVNTSTRVYVAKEENDINIQNTVIKSAIVLRLIVSLISFVLILAFSKTITNIFGDVDKYPHLFNMLFLGALLVFFNSFSEFFKELFVGIIEFKNIFFISILEYGGYFLFGVGLLALGTYEKVFPFDTVFLLEIGYILAVFCVTIYGFAVLIRKRTDIFKKAKVAKAYILCILKYAFPILVTSFWAMILMEIDTIMIGNYYTGSEVAIYSVAKKLCTKAAHINLALCTGTMPIFAVLTKENIKSKEQMFRKILFINMILSFAVVLIFWVLGPTLIGLLYGQEYEKSQMVLKILMGYYVLSGFSNIYGALLDYQEKAKTRSLCYIIMIIVNITLNYLWIPQFGANGAAAATSISVIPYLVLLIISKKKLVHRIIKM